MADEAVNAASIYTGGALLALISLHSSPCRVCYCNAADRKTLWQLIVASIA